MRKSKHFYKVSTINELGTIIYYLPKTFARNRIWSFRNLLQTKENYIDVFRHLQDAEWRKRQEFKRSSNWNLNHDNASAYSAHVVQQFLAKHDIPIVLQPLYLPDLFLFNFFLYSKMKMALKGQHFQYVDEIKHSATEHLRGFSKNDFQKYFQKYLTNIIIMDSVLRYLN